MSTIEFPWVDEHRFQLGLGVVLRLPLFSLVISCSFLLVGRRSRKCFIFGLLYGTGMEHLQSSLYLRAQSGKGKEHEIQSKAQGGTRKEPETNDRVSILSR